MATDEVVYGRDAVDSSRGLGMGGWGVSTIVAQGEAFKIPRGASGWEGGGGVS